MDRRSGHPAGGYRRHQQHHAGDRPRADAGDRRSPRIGSQAAHDHLADHERGFRTDVRGRRFRAGTGRRTAVGGRNAPLARHAGPAEGPNPVLDRHALARGAGRRRPRRRYPAGQPGHADQAGRRHTGRIETKHKPKNSK